jgi:ATP-dependent helicase HrpA
MMPRRLIGKSIDEIFEILPEIQQWIAANRKDRNLGEIAEDSKSNLPGCSARISPGVRALPDCANTRRLRAIRSRLGRLSSLPIVKDLEKMDRFRRLWLPWFLNHTAQPEDPARWPLGWTLEEYRISLFAPDVPLLGKVSEKAHRGDACSELLTLKRQLLLRFAWMLQDL